MIASLSPPPPRLYEHLLCDCLQWDSQLQLHSSCGSPQILIYQLLHHLLLRSTVKDICRHQELCVINTSFSCHSQPLLWVQSPPILSLLWLLLLCRFPRDVCVLGSKKEKELEAKGRPLALPLPGSVPISPQVTRHLCGKEGAQKRPSEAVKNSSTPFKRSGAFKR